MKKKYLLLSFLTLFTFFNVALSSLLDENLYGDRRNEIVVSARKRFKTEEDIAKVYNVYVVEDLLRDVKQDIKIAYENYNKYPNDAAGLDIMFYSDIFEKLVRFQELFVNVIPFRCGYKVSDVTYSFVMDLKQYNFVQDGGKKYYSNLYRGICEDRPFHKIRLYFDSSKDAKKLKGKTIFCQLQGDIYVCKYNIHPLYNYKFQKIDASGTIHITPFGSEYWTPQAKCEICSWVSYCTKRTTCLRSKCFFDTVNAGEKIDLNAEIEAFKKIRK